MAFLKELFEKRNKAAAEFYRLRDVLEARGKEAKEGEAVAFTPEELTQYKRVDAEILNLKEQIAVAQRAADIEKEINDDSASYARMSTLGQGPVQGTDRIDGPVTEEVRKLAFRAWFRHQMDEEPTQAETDAAKRIGLNPAIKQIKTTLIPSDVRRRIHDECRRSHPTRHPDIVSRALSAYLPATGAYTKLPGSFVQNLEINMLAYSGVEQFAEVMTTTTGERMSWPTADDTSNTGAQLGENTSYGASVDPSFAQVHWDAYKFSSKPTLVPFELLEDSQFDLAAELGRMHGERLGRIGNTRFTTGSGADTCKGIVTASTAGITTASGTAIAADEFKRLIRAVDPAYRTMGCAFTMHDNIVLALDLLKDGNGQYMWRPGLTEGTPDRFLNYPIFINQDMASSVATTAITALFGLLSKYKIRRVNQVRTYRLEERYRDTDQDGFISLVRQDGNLLDAGAHPVKRLTQA